MDGCWSYDSYPETNLQMTKVNTQLDYMIRLESFTKSEDLPPESWSDAKIQTSSNLNGRIEGVINSVLSPGVRVGKEHCQR